MKGDLLLKLLKGVGEAGSTLEELFIIFTSPYGSNHSVIQRRLDLFRKEKRSSTKNRTENRSFHNLLYRLRTDGLIENKKRVTEKRFVVTKRGKDILKKLLTSKRDELPALPSKNEMEATIKIVMFDIPEQERRKRRWLNSVLKNLKYVRAQRSVWIGKTKIPEELIRHLKKLNMLSYVEIFSVSKSGSLKHMDL